MWTNAHGKNKVLGWCRRCNYIWFPENKVPMNKIEFEQWRREQLAIEEERRRSAEKAIKNLQSEKLWETYNKLLNDWSIGILKEWGIRKDWADFWKLGMMPDYTVHGDSGEYHTPAITIPIWQQDGSVANVKLRTLNPKSANDRYRSLYKTGVPFTFTAFPKMKSDTCLLVEGEKKAMVCAEWSESKFQVVGLPTKTPDPETLDSLKSFGKITVILDPDAEKDALPRLVKMLGVERCEVVCLPDKVDDMIVQYGLKLKEALRYSKKLEV